MEYKVMGLDPGTFRTGWSLLSITDSAIELTDYGVLSSSAKSIERRIQMIGQDLKQLYSECPSRTETVIEQVFFGKNPNTAFKLGQVFGMCVYQAGCFNSPVYSYATRFIKQAVTGSGNAGKAAVKTFVANIFPSINKNIADDAADAVAIALCHAYQKQNPAANLQNQQGLMK